MPKRSAVTETAATTPVVAAPAPASEPTPAPDEKVLETPADAPAGSSPAIRGGFFYGLVGVAVKKDKDKKATGDNIGSFRFRAQKTGDEKPAVDESNVEMPYCGTDAAGIEALADFTYTVVKLVYEKGVPVFVDVETKGIAAAANFVKDRSTVETVRQRCANNKLDAKAMRELFLQQYGTELPGVQPPVLDIMAIITDPNRTDAEKMMAMAAQLQALANTGRIIVR